MPARPEKARLDAIDWLRGLAVLLMLQTHALDAWLRPELRQTPGFRWSQFLGGYPAPLFLFLAGLGLALAAEGRLLRGATPGETARVGLRRGLEVCGYALLFRLWMFATSRFSAPPASLLRVDVLNCIGVALLLTAALVLPWPRPRARLAAALALAAACAAAAPFTWDAVAWPEWLPAPLLGYVSGRPPRAMFPIFPWAAYLAAGAAAGLLMARARAARRLPARLRQLVLLGLVGLAAGLALDRLPSLAPVYDYWHTSPSLVLVKTGVLLGLLGLAFLWDARRDGPGFSPLRQMGTTSLLLYWAHIELVYGVLLLPGLRKSLPWPAALAALGALTLAMLLLSWLRGNGSRLAEAWSRRAGRGLTLPEGA